MNEPSSSILHSYVAMWNNQWVYISSLKLHHFPALVTLELLCFACVMYPCGCQHCWHEAWPRGLREAHQKLRRAKENSGASWIMAHPTRDPCWSSCSCRLAPASLGHAWACQDSYWMVLRRIDIDGTHVSGVNRAVANSTRHINLLSYLSWNSLKRTIAGHLQIVMGTSKNTWGN